MTMLACTLARCAGVRTPEPVLGADGAVAAATTALEPGAAKRAPLGALESPCMMPCATDAYFAPL